jgi:hypothetical protein
MKKGDKSLLKGHRLQHPVDMQRTKTKDATAAKLRAIRQKNSGRVLQLSRVAMKAIQEIKQIEAAMAAEAAAEAQCPAVGRSFEAIYSDFVNDACADVIDALEKDAAN